MDTALPKDRMSIISSFYDGILNYLDFRITNAYTEEGIHTKMKLIKRQGGAFQVRI